MKRKEKIKWFDRESRGLLRLIINHDKSDHINHGLSKDDIYSLYSKNGREQRVHKIDTWCLLNNSTPYIFQAFWPDT